MEYAAKAENCSAAPIRVFLIDEEVVVRAGVRIMIDSWPNSKVVGEADIVPQALTAMEALKPDLIVFSHSGRSIESLGCLSVLTKTAGQVPLVLLTSSRDPKVGAVAVNAGAKWIMLKQDAASELRIAIEKVYSGEARINSEAGTHRRPARHDQERQLRPNLNGSLTNRQREVAVLVSSGCTNRQVGVHLGITEVTVRHHLSSIFSKLGIANRFELISWVYRGGN